MYIHASDLTYKTLSVYIYVKTETSVADTIDKTISDAPRLTGSLAGVLQMRATKTTKQEPMTNHSSAVN